MTRGICSDPIKEAERVRKQKEGAQRRSQDPEWKRKNKEATQKSAQQRAQDPEWRKRNKEMCEKRSKNPAYREKISEAHKKLAQDPEHIKKLSEAAIRRSQNPEWIKNSKIIYKKRSENEQWIKSHDEASQKLSQNPIWKKNHKEAMKKLGEDPEHRKKLIEFAIGGFWYGNVRYYEGQQYCEKFNDNLKERVRAFFNYTCPECGTPQNGIKLAVHHVNYNKQSCCDPEAPRLFVPLCVNGGCHQGTNRNRKEWEQHFVEMLIGYYQGKSYFTPEEMEAYSNQNL